MLVAVLLIAASYGLVIRNGNTEPTHRYNSRYLDKDKIAAGIDIPTASIHCHTVSNDFEL